MSAENGKLFATTPPSSATAAAAATPTAQQQQQLPAKAAATTTKIKREPGSMLTNGSAAAVALTKLSSFTPGRDLTLGGRGAPGAGGGGNKKVFTPNLNVVRNKNANVKTSKDTTARGRGGGRGKSERGRGGGRGGRGGGGNSALIQTTGVFSEGAGAVNIRQRISGGGSSFSRSSDDAPSAMRKPMLVKRENQKIDVKAEAAHVRELLGDSDDDDFGDEKTDLEQIPIKLNEGKWKYVKFEKPEIKLEKSETNDDGDNDEVNNATSHDDKTVAIVQQIQQMHMQQRTQSCSTRYPESVEQLLEAKQPQIFLMQLPDTLPCEDDGSDSPEKTAGSDSKEQPVNDTVDPSTPATKTTTNSSSNSLKKMEEGQIGKLLRYKSGKIKLVLGESHFDLDMGMETGFLQDLMSIDTNREERSGNMVNLGTIQAKLTATPDWEYLLKQQFAQQQKP